MKFAILIAVILYVLAILDSKKDDAIAITVMCVFIPAVVFIILKFVMKSDDKNEILNNNEQKSQPKSNDRISPVNPVDIIYQSITSASLPDRYLSIDDTILQYCNYEHIEADIKRYNIQREVSQLISKRKNEHNENFIKRHLNDPIFSRICGYSMDEEQRRTVLCDSKHNLVVAGAGTGKTLTICGKIQYLLENDMAKEDEILLMSYSRDSVDDISKKVLKISPNIQATTFHSLGLRILSEHLGEKKAVEDQIMTHIKTFFDERLGVDIKFMKTILKYFSCYINPIAPDKDNTLVFEQEENKSEKYRTLKGYLKSFNNDPKNNVTIKEERVKSIQELVLANFLFVNGIEYEYEKPYEINTATLEKRQYCPDFYLPKYKIYIEHYGVDKNGRARQYFGNGEQKYIQSMEWKRETHQKNKTVCVETYSYEFSNGTVFTNLRKNLKDKGVKFKPLTQIQIKETVAKLYKGYDFSKFMDVSGTFLSLYKSKYKDNSAFESLGLGLSGYERERAKIFLEIAKEIYDYYISSLKENDKIDFDDMILQSTDLLDTPKFKTKYCYKYILVDEFQDISESRFNFLKKLAEHGNSKLMAVGDDWQSIYRFSGSDINIFWNFSRITFPDATINRISRTHRNSIELQEVAEKFITKNPRQIKKQIKSDKHQQNPIRIVTYNNEWDGFDALKKVLGEISAMNYSAKVLILGRNNKDIDKDFQSEVNHAFRNLKISYTTIHRSKGLESDFVILVNAGNIPSKRTDDPLINLLLGTPEDFQFAEERRLFYVALTRTKSIVYILEQHGDKSVFVSEIKQDCYETHFFGNNNTKEKNNESPKSEQLIGNIGSTNKDNLVITNGEYIELSSPVGNIHMIEKFPSDKKFSLNRARDYAKNLRKGGFSDWRLPTIEDFKQVRNIKDIDDSIYSKSFWSSTLMFGDTPVAWYMYFDNPYSMNTSEKSRHYVICVR